MHEAVIQILWIRSAHAKHPSVPRHPSIPQHLALPCFLCTLYSRNISEVFCFITTLRKFISIRNKKLQPIGTRPCFNNWRCHVFSYSDLTPRCIMREQNFWLAMKANRLRLRQLRRQAFESPTPICRLADGCGRWVWQMGVAAGLRSAADCTNGGVVWNGCLADILAKCRRRSRIARILVCLHLMYEELCRCCVWS